MKRWINLLVFVYLLFCLTNHFGIYALYLLITSCCIAKWVVDRNKFTIELSVKINDKSASG